MITPETLAEWKLHAQGNLGARLVMLDRIKACIVEIERLQTENARLRAALREVLDRTGFDAWLYRLTPGQRAHCSYGHPEDEYARHVVGDLLDE